MVLVFLIIRRPQRSTRFPYTSHFRSIHEAVALFTCNRTELHLVAADSVEAESAALAILSRQAGIRATELVGAIYSLRGDRKSTRLNSSHANISYAVFCLKKKKTKHTT